jgi:hypothetical protein
MDNETSLPLYNEKVVDFTMRFFTRDGAIVPGERIAALADEFLRRLLLPGVEPVEIWTARPKIGARMNMPQFTEAKWKAVRKKIEAGAYGALSLRAKDELSPYPIVTFDTAVDPQQVVDSRGVGRIDFECKIHYLVQLLKAGDGAERVKSFFRFMQDTLAGLAVCGYANVGVGGRYSWKSMRRPHDIPVAFTMVDGNLDGYMIRDRMGIKGTFWANYLDREYAARLGGAEALRAQLALYQPHVDASGGIGFFATDSPIPEDTPENRQRYRDLDSVMRPLWLSRSEVSPNKHDFMGYFYRD